MAQNDQSATSQEAAASAGQLDDHSGQGSRGRGASWAVVVLIVAGFVVGGLGLVLDVNVPMIVVGVALVVVGGIVGAVGGIMDQVH